MKKIGLDASTTTVGFAFVDNKNVIDIGFIPIDKQKTIRDKVQLTMEELTKLDPFAEVDKFISKTIFLVLVVVEHHNKQL